MNLSSAVGIPSCRAPPSAFGISTPALPLFWRTRFNANFKLLWLITSSRRLVEKFGRSVRWFLVRSPYEKTSRFDFSFPIIILTNYPDGSAQQQTRPPGLREVTFSTQLLGFTFKGFWWIWAFTIPVICHAREHRKRPVTWLAPRR